MSDEVNYEISDDNPEVRLGYSSSTNISFGGTEGTGFSRAEWKDLDQESRAEVFEELVWNLIEVWELDDDEPDHYPGLR